MFERILVALDGSSASEAALPDATILARAFSSTLILAHVVEAHPPKSVHGQPHLAEAISAAAYLEAVAAALRKEGLAVETHVHEAEEGSLSTRRELADALASHSSELGFDLAVMAAHGRKGASDFLKSSLPLKVTAAGCSSVYIAKRMDSGGPHEAPASILLPLDGKSEHEAALAQAAALAKGLRIPIELFAVVPRRGSDSQGSGGASAHFSPALNRASLEFAAEETAVYLRGVSEGLASQGIAASWTVERGRPVKRILKRATATGALVVLSTHRKLGIDAALDGCVAFSVATAYGGDTLITPVPRCTDRG